MLPLFFFECETFDNLLYYGNWVDKDSWYIKHHTHASGSAFVVSHKEGSRMYKKFKENIKPGEYKVFLRIVLNRSKNTKNIYKVSLGYYKDGKFISESSSQLIQDFTGSGYGWYPLEKYLKIEKPCNVIEIESVKIENMGIGDDPEYPKPYGIIDCVIITDEEVELIKDKARGRNEIKFLSGKDPRKEEQKIDTSIKTEIQTKNIPSEREIFIPSKNILRNSSFEFSIKPFFAGGGYTITTGNNIDADCLSTESPYHGKYCLKLTPKIQNITEMFTGSDKKPVYGNSISIVYMERFLKDKVEKILKEGPLVISYYLRTNGKTIRLEGKEINHTDWRRYYFPFKPFTLIEFTTDDPEAIVWIDAVQIERGTQPTEYQPLEGIEVGFIIDRLCNIFYKEKNLTFEISVIKGKGKPENLVINYYILNSHLEKEFGRKEIIYIKPNSVITKKIDIPFEKLGTYIIVYEVKNHPELGYCIPFHVIENPEKTKGKKPLLGAIISTNEEIMKIFKHAGFDWVNSLNDRLVYFDYIWPKREEMRFFDKWYKMWEEKYGIEYAFWRPPFNPPGWTKNIYGREPAAHMGQPNISYENWEEFWKRFTEHVNYLKVWMPTDEQSYHRGPEESIPYIEIASKWIRKNIKDAIIMNSTQPRHLLEMLKIKPDLDIGDAFGGSRHGFERNTFFYDRCLKELIKKEYWVVGVGWGLGDWFSILNPETFSVNKDYIEKKWVYGLSKVIIDIFNESSIVGVERFGLYTAKFDKGSDPYSLFTYDNSIKPFGINFINIINFLRGHKPGNIIYFDKAYGVFAEYLYLKDGKVCALISPDGSYEKIEINLNLPKDKVIIYDHNLNQMPYSKKIILPVSKFILIKDNGIGEKKLVENIKKMEIYPVNYERKLVITNKGGIEITTYQKKKNKIEKVNSINLSIDAGLKYPICPKSKYDRFIPWAIVSKRTEKGKIKLDGKIEESYWFEVAPSFIYCWDALDGSFGALQGIENFGNVFSLEDISLNFRSLWDEENLYFSFEILDNIKTLEDKLLLKIDSNLLGDLYISEFNEDDFSIEIPLREGDYSVDILNYMEKNIGKCEVFSFPNEKGFTVEIKIPFSSINLKKAENKTIGLNIEIYDKDKEDYFTVLSWTGNYMPRKSPFGFGQLIFLK